MECNQGGGSSGGSGVDCVWRSGQFGENSKVCNRKVVKWVAVVVGIGLVISGGWMMMAREGELLSPLGRRLGVLRREDERRVVGFLPTWMVGKTQNYCEELTHLVFLGVEVEENGDLKWDYQAKKVESNEYLNLKKRFKRCGGKNILGIKLFDDKKIEKLLEDTTNLMEQVREAVRSRGFDGVNVDFEYMGDPEAVLEEEFVDFIRKLKEAGVGEVSIDVFANTVIKGEEGGLRNLTEIADQVIVMAYDFHRQGSQYAGSVAPINSGPGERNITEVAKRIIDLGLKRKKIILAYPLYGYEWITADESLGSKVESYVEFWSLKRTMAKTDVEVKFDEISMTPWATWRLPVIKSKVESYKVGNRWKKRTVKHTTEEVHQIYFENERSLEAKLDLAKQTGVGGVGFWALGYEPNNFLKEILN